MSFSSAYPAAFSPDGRYISACSGRLMQIHEVATGSVVYSWEMLPSATQTAFSPCGERISVVDTSGVLEVRTVAGEFIFSTQHPESQPTNHDWSQDGKEVIQWSEQGTVRTVDVKSGLVSHQVKTGKVVHGQVVPNERLLTLAVSKWDEVPVAAFNWLYAKTLEYIPPERELDRSKNRLRWGSSVKRHAFWCINEGDLELFDARLAKLCEIPLDGASYDSVEFAPDDSELTIFGIGPTMRLKFPTLELIESYSFRPEIVRYSAAARKLLLGARDGALLLPWVAKTYDIFTTAARADGNYENSVWASWTGGEGSWPTGENLQSAIGQMLENEDYLMNDDVEEMFADKKAEELFHKVYDIGRTEIMSGKDDALLEVDGMVFMWKEKSDTSIDRMSE